MTGTLVLLRLALRRDRVAIPVWVLSIAAMIALTTSSLKRLYPSRADLVQLASTVSDNPAVIAIRGQARGLDTIGGTASWQVGWFAMLAAALMSLLLVVRHSRGDEESARMELVLAQSVARQAPLAAAISVVAIANAAIAVAVAAVMAAYGTPVSGSLALGASIGGAGLVFGTVAAVTAQLATTGRAAAGLAGAVLGSAYVIRAVGDVKHESVPWLTWLSPLGWAEEMRPFAGDRWWPLALLIALALVLVVVAVRLQAARDFQAGLIAPRPGPPRASGILTTPWGLAVRLERGTFAGWAAGVFAVGFAYGSIGNSIRDIIDTSSQLHDVFIRSGGDVVDAFFSTTSMVLALFATGFALQAVLRLRSEEVAGLAEPVLATALSRVSWALSHVAVAFFGSIALTAIAGLGTGLAYSFQGGGPGDIAQLTWAAVVQSPAVWLLASIALVTIAMIPRASVSVSWSLLGVCVVISFMGPLLGLPDWVSRLSPYDHIPKLPAADLTVLPLLALTAVAAAAAVVGLAAVRRRDIG